jgi:diaminopimelate decarboxylase
MVALAGSLFAAPPASIDVGGGLFGRMPAAVAAQFGGAVPDWTERSPARSVMCSRRPIRAQMRQLIVEPGTAVVADAVSFVCRVAAIKTLAGDGGGDHRQHPDHQDAATPSGCRSRSCADPAATGPALEVRWTSWATRMEGDVLQEAVPGPIRVGDLVVIGNVGAYVTAFKPPFIRPSPPMLATDGPGSTPIVVRRAETLDDILATYLVPPTEAS